MSVELCDRCGVPAAHRLEKALPAPPRVLTFCGHHAHEYGSELIANGWQIVQPERIA